MGDTNLMIRLLTIIWNDAIPAMLFVHVATYLVKLTILYSLSHRVKTYQVVLYYRPLF